VSILCNPDRNLAGSWKVEMTSDFFLLSSF